MLIHPRSLPENCGILSLAEVWLAEVCADDGALPASAMPMPSAAAVAQSHALRATELVLHLNPNVSICSSPLRRFDCLPRAPETTSRAFPNASDFRRRLEVGVSAKHARPGLRKLAMMAPVEPCSSKAAKAAP